MSKNTYAGSAGGTTTTTNQVVVNQSAQTITAAVTNVTNASALYQTAQTLTVPGTASINLLNVNNTTMGAVTMGTVNGYRMPQHQTGSTSTSASGIVTLTLPSAMQSPPTVCVQYTGTSTSAVYTFSVTAVTTTKFTVTAVQSGALGVVQQANSAVPFSWHATAL